MRMHFCHFLRDSSASTTVEYGLVLAFAALATSTGVGLAAETTIELWSDIEREIWAALGSTGR
jgi:Flp pilus assembly pilin Flp